MTDAPRSRAWPPAANTPRHSTGPATRRTRLGAIWGATAACLALLLAAAAGLLPASAGAAQPDGDLEAVSALRCWRRVDRGAVRIAEPFGMTITCRVVESPRGRTLLDTVGLEPESIDLLPFEVLGGERYPDAAGDGYRFLQYHYVLRVVGEDYFGADVEIPALSLNYRIERAAADGAVLAGRELTYVLPPAVIRLLSLVPDAASDIRGVSPGTLGDAEARLARADLLLLAAAGLALVAVGVLLAGFRRAHRSRRAGRKRATRPVGLAAAAGAVRRELAASRPADGVEDWTDERVERALAALRIAGAIAVGRPLAERASTPGAEPRSGELDVRGGRLAGRSVFVSAAVTPVELAAATTGGPGAAMADARERIGTALALFSAARYARPGTSLPGTLTLALDDAADAVRRLRLGAWPPLRALRQAGTALQAWRNRLWRR